MKRKWVSGRLKLRGLSASASVSMRQCLSWAWNLPARCGFLARNAAAPCSTSWRMRCLVMKDLWGLISREGS